MSRCVTRVARALLLRRWATAVFVAALPTAFPVAATLAQPVAVIREATRITGLGIMEAMRDARPGMREYELQALLTSIMAHATSRAIVADAVVEMDSIVSRMSYS